MSTVTLGDCPAKAPCAVWTQDPRALKLLASCAKNPPKGGYVHGGFVLHREQDCSYRYTGYRADALAAIREEYGAAALKQAQDSDDYAAFEAWTSEQPPPGGPDK